MAVVLFISLSIPSYAAEKLFQERSYFGTSVNMTLCHGAAKRGRAHEAMAMAWQRFDSVQARMNMFDPVSDVSGLNAAAGVAFRVHDDVYDLIERSVSYARMTGGVFDISVGPLIALWKKAGLQGRLPEAEEIGRVKTLIGAQRIELLGHGLVRLPAGMRIDLGGNAAGFVADAAAAVLRENGFRDFLIDAGGELLAGGVSCEGRPWRAGIRSPDGEDLVLGVVELKDEAFSTSGSYEKYVEIQGQRWSHIIDPLTGYPERGVVSATVIAPQALDADVLSTALCILGPGPGGALIDSLGPGYAAMFIIEDEHGALVQKSTRGYAVHKSSP
jgi:thiamine biosynthesis lipoprotein